MRWFSFLLLLSAIAARAQVERILPLLTHHVQSKAFQEVYGYADRMDIQTSIQDEQHDVVLYLKNSKVASIIFRSDFPYDFRSRGRERRVRKCVEKEGWRLRDPAYFHDGLYHEEVYLDPQGNEVGFQYTEGRLAFIEVRKADWDPDSETDQAYVLDGQYFDRIVHLEQYHTYRKDPYFFYFDPATAECVSGDCENGTGQLRWPDGKRFQGTIVNGKAVEGTVEITDLRYSKMKLTGSIKHNMLHGQVQVNSPMALYGKVEMRLGIAVSTSSLNYPLNHQYVGQLLPDFQPRHEAGTWSTYTFMDGVKAQVTLKQEFYAADPATYAKIDYGNGYRYEGYIDAEFRRSGNGTIYDDVGKRQMSSLFQEDSIDRRNRHVVWSYEHGLTQSGIYSLSKGFNGAVVSKVSNLDGTYTVEGTYRNNAPVGVHSLRDVSRNQLLGSGTYVNGVLQSGMDVYGDPNKGLMTQVARVESLVEEVEKLKAEVRQLALREGWSIRQELDFAAKQTVILNEGVSSDVSDVRQMEVNLVVLDPFSRSSYYTVSAYAYNYASSPANYPSGKLLPDASEPRIYLLNATLRTEDYSKFHYSIRPMDPSKAESACTVFVLTRRM